jgi:hypothetical protein
MCLSLTACHSGDGDDESNSAGGSSSNTSGVPPPITFTLGFRFTEEVEPNDSVGTATVVTLPTPVRTEDLVGAVMMGRVNPSLDAMDTFSFAAQRSKTYFFKLCESTCNTTAGNDRSGNPDSLDVSIAYFRVRDASGNVLMTTQTNASTQNYFALGVAGGVITYVEVVANSATNAWQNYRMSAMEQP